MELLTFSLRSARNFTTCISVLSMACAPSRQPSIELSSSDFDLNPLVGVWRGSYNSSQTGRSGTIAFTLRAGEGSASGNVVMIPRPDSLLTQEEREALSNLATQDRAVLKIHFVRKEGGSLAGTLDPYRDPDCDCPVTTTFQGAFVDAGTIQGTFTTVPSTPGRSVTGGKWRVVRVKRL
ncbi:MAG TPA: hypothetical protein VE110_11170 [Gemmatimonadaceae bacterium]|nr:hypothetical protein [Gemmatimonadaceae bacterium]